MKYNIKKYDDILEYLGVLEKFNKYRLEDGEIPINENCDYRDYVSGSFLFCKTDEGEEFWYKLVSIDIVKTTREMKLKKILR